MDRTQRRGLLTRLPQHLRAVHAARPHFSFLRFSKAAANHRPSPSDGGIVNGSYSGSAVEPWSDDTDAREGLGELSNGPLTWHAPGYFEVTHLSRWATTALWIYLLSDQVTPDLAHLWQRLFRGEISMECNPLVWPRLHCENPIPKWHFTS